MAGTITHEWNGTVLTVTSDSGTSSADLKGSTGDTGPRGPQGKCGVILKADGTVDTSAYATEDYVDTKIEQAVTSGVDLSNYYTKTEINNKGYLTQHQTLKTINGESIVGSGDIEISGSTADLSDYYTKSQVDAKIPSLTGYATENYVTTKIAEAQLSGGDGSGVDLSGYATQDWVNAKGYLTEHQSLTDYATKTYVDNAVAGSSGGSGAQIWYVDAQIDSNNNITSINKTLTEIQTAYKEGNEVVLRAVYEPFSSLYDYVYMNLIGYQEGVQITFGNAICVSNYSLATTIVISVNGNVMYQNRIEPSQYLTEHQALKTINGQSIVGTGDITISGGSEVTPVTSISSSSTDSDIPSAKAVYTAVNNKYTKPSGGIPASDLASGVIPSVPTFSLSGTTLTITT